jgi:hypothetical protein
VRVGSVNNADHRYPMPLLIDPVDHAVRATAATAPIIERRAESSADALWVVEQRPDNELVRRERHRFGQVIGELTAGRG